MLSIKFQYGEGGRLYLTSGFVCAFFYSYVVPKEFIIHGVALSVRAVGRDRSPLNVSTSETLREFQI